jgi:5-methylcytosine-specific restriction endonuclease McrA
MEETRICSKCRVVKPLTAFRVKHATGRKPAPVAECGDCERAGRRGYAAWLVRADPQRAHTYDAAYALRRKQDPQRYAQHQTCKRRWYQTHRDLALDCKHRRRARERGNQAERVDRAAIIARDGLVCYLCGQAVDPAAPLYAPHKLALDHVIPLERHGPNTAANLRVACWSCNTRKGTRLLEELEWYQPLDSRAESML